MLKDLLGNKVLVLSLFYLTAPLSALLTPISDDLPAADTATATCDDWCRSSRITARHIENKGIGYNTGYTTLEMFLAPPTDYWSMMPFIDLRGHVFDDGHWAANGGLGLRSLYKDRIYGGYVYYDYRDTKRKSYNQMSFGLETLGTFWDLRLNGYAVVGGGKSSPYEIEFSRFGGNSVYYTQKVQYALSGGNAEVGFYPFKRQNVTLYTGMGPYYLKGPGSSAVWGGQLRAKAMWKDYVGAELSYSYDHAFKNIVQGQVFLSYSFGPKRKLNKNEKRSCVDNNLLCQRMIEPVAKNEIIPVKTKKSQKQAIDPATGQPYTIWFVNNLSHSAGTYESPFFTLTAAQSASQPNDLIYVYPGDLTSTGLSNGITLQNGQQLLAATTNHSLLTKAGPILLPAQVSESNAPLLSNTTGAVVTLASDNTVSGFYIQNAMGAGILASGSHNATLTQNYIQGINTSYNGIELDNVTGNVSVSSNTILYQAACVNIDNTTAISNASYLFKDNALHVDGGASGFNINYTEGANNYFLSANNNLYGSNSAGVNITCTNTTANTPHIFDIKNCVIGTADNYAVKLVLNNLSVSQLNVQDSTINSADGIYTISYNQSQLTTNVSDNAFTVNQYALRPETHNASLTNTTFINNSISSTGYPIYFNSYDTSTLAVDISTNTINNYQYAIFTDLANSATLTGKINNNNITSLNYGIYTYAPGNTTFAADITNNTINSAYYHLELLSNGSSNYSGNFIGNTFVGTDDDDTIYWSLNTAGTISSLISNNTFTGNYSGIELSSSGTGPCTIQILNNTIQNVITNGVEVDNSGTNFDLTISNNTFQGFGTNAVNVSNTNGEMCLQFNNNTSNPYPNAYVIDGAGGVLNLVTPIGNLGQLQTSGTTAVSVCP